MRRWNGWGETLYNQPLLANTQQFLENHLGKTTEIVYPSLTDQLRKIPVSRKNANPYWSVSPQERLFHARGQSFQDWVELRFGIVQSVPDAVAYPDSTHAIIHLFKLAASEGFVIIPYGGGTSVVGHLTPQGDKPTLTINLSRLNRLLDFDAKNLTARFGTGITGSHLEALLLARGYTLGHFPQSFEYSTLGGWVATRSSGQQSLYYGRIEQIFGGGEFITPRGSLEIPFFPASAASLDLKEMVLGSEGRLGILTEATVKISRIPKEEAFFGAFFPNWETGVQAARLIAQQATCVSMVRLCDAAETAATLAQSSQSNLVSYLNTYLSYRNCDDEKCLLLIGFTSQSSNCFDREKKDIFSIIKQQYGIIIGKLLGKLWQKNRFKTPYIRNSLWDAGFGLDTLETATSWDNIDSLKLSIHKAIQDTFEKRHLPVYIMSHLSQVYPQGSSLYITFIFKLARTAEENLNFWRLAKEAASRAIMAGKATISHQHGVGLDHKPYLVAEKSLLGLGAIKSLMQYFDPSALLNPGKIME